jgi:hypothetical protein
MRADSNEANGVGGRASRATASSDGSKTSGVLTTIWRQQQRQASSESAVWPLGAPENSQVAWENTSHVTKSKPVSRRMVTAAILKIVTREGMPCV